MNEQPRSLRAIAEVALPGIVLERLAGAGMVWLVGTGSSEHAACFGAAAFERAGLRARAISAAAFVHGVRLRADECVVVLSHTGESFYARRAREKALEAKALAVSVTGAGAGWPEALVTTPREASETYSRSHTAAMAMLARVAAALGATALGPEAVHETADVVERTLQEPESEIVPGFERAVVLTGSGPAAVTAREGALKLREAARTLAEAFDSEYLLHGNAVPLSAGDLLLVLDAQRDADGLAALLTDAAQAEGVAVARMEQPEPADPLLAQIPLTVRLQRLALERAVATGCDPDTVIAGAWADDRLWNPGGPIETDPSAAG